ncbi:Bacteriophage lambda head decoration protein D [Azospirillum oryzae]|uniref:Bacteriophage lambda head decoration protein D n=1 Tax=Azospirillum oryzae TaxID=286727 RepID=A0A1X7F9S8_9PROT|nr:head decoration protein [Azospirillum oryzae]SMF48021.1 Bacteriophage lambda head decoration protein D [Azospirillum oryzae]
MTTYSSSPFQPGVTSDVFTPDQLIAGRFPLVTDTVTLVSGQNLARGAVLGKITASGKYTLSLSASSDGSQVPSAILADAVDASGGDKLAGVYLAGEFNTNALTIGTGHTAASIKDTLRDAGIYLKTAVSAADPS